MRVKTASIRDVQRIGHRVRLASDASWWLPPAVYVRSVRISVGLPCLSGRSPRPIARDSGSGSMTRKLDNPAGHSSVGRGFQWEYPSAVSFQGWWPRSARVEEGGRGRSAIREVQ